MSVLIYIETSIPSFYYDTRPELEHQARRQWTREWWEVAKVRDRMGGGREKGGGAVEFFFVPDRPAARRMPKLRAVPPPFHTTRSGNARRAFPTARFHSAIANRRLLLETSELAGNDASKYCRGMKTLTIAEAVSNLPNWLTQAIAGEEIGIRSGDAVVVLRPLAAARDAEREHLSPREALRRLQQNARLSPVEAENYLKEVRAERIAAEDRGAA